MPSISSLGERALIERLHQRIGSAPRHVLVGIGDDAAVIVPERGTCDVLTTDSLVESVHFRRDWTMPAAIGHKALAVNLSDLASMGATPRASLLSLALPDDFPLDDFDALIDGFASLASRTGAALVGGNLTRSPGPLVVDVTAIGAVRPRRLLRRTGARPGYVLFVTGAIGAAAAGLAIREAGLATADLDGDARACVERYERPEPRLRCGWIVGKVSAAAAAIDLSDGLGDAARQLAEASGLGVVVDAGALPVHPGARAWCASAHRDPVHFACSGGEDYELAFAVAPRSRGKFLAAMRRCKDVSVTPVGRFTTEPGAWLEFADRRETLPSGFSHFPLTARR